MSERPPRNRITGSQEGDMMMSILPLETSIYTSRFKYGDVDRETVSVRPFSSRHTAFNI
jgi:hypothetical protein